MCPCTNVCILTKVTAQYFFYKVYFMYLLYILCIGSHDCYWNYCWRDVYVCEPADLSAVLEQTWKQKTRTAGSHPTNARMWLNFWYVTIIEQEDCYPALIQKLKERVNFWVLLKERKETIFSESWFSSFSYKPYEECFGACIQTAGWLFSQMFNNKPIALDFQIDLFGFRQ